MSYNTALAACGRLILKGLSVHGPGVKSEDMRRADFGVNPWAARSGLRLHQTRIPH